MTSRRKFLRKTGAGVAGVAAITGSAAACARPGRSGSKITWRLQTYAGPELAEHVIKPSIDSFNEVANGEMEIELYYSDELVPTSDLFAALQDGTVDAVQSDDDSIAAPVDISVFGGYFPFACRYSLDVPVLFHQWGLADIWEEAYGEVEGVTWLGAGAWDPCHFNTVEPIRSVADLDGLRVSTFPTAGRFLSRFGVVPATLPSGDITAAVQRGELDGIAWSGITEDYTVGWADVTNYFLTNNISGAWCGSYFANSAKWDALPEHLKELFRLCMDSSHYYRQHWYWGGEAQLRVSGTKLELTSIPDDEWAQVESEARVFWDEIAAESPRNARVVSILRDYSAAMEQAGRPYRYT